MSVHDAPEMNVLTKKALSDFYKKFISKFLKEYGGLLKLYDKDPNKVEKIAEEIKSSGIHSFKEIMGVLSETKQEIEKSYMETLLYTILKNLEIPESTTKELGDIDSTGFYKKLDNLSIDYKGVYTIVETVNKEFDQVLGIFEIPLYQIKIK